MEEELVDLFSEFDELPMEVQDILNSFDDMECPYQECKRLLALLEPLGYEFDYGLCGTPFDLKKI